MIRNFQETTGWLSKFRICLFMSKLFAKCAADFRLRTSSVFRDYDLDISQLKDVSDDISSFADSCTEFLSRICTNQVLCRMNEMALNLTLYTKLQSMKEVGLIAEMQKSLQVKGSGERFADLVVTVHSGKDNECSYLIELKYLPKGKSSDEKLARLVQDASAQVLRYKSSPDFENRQVKAYVMIFSGPECVCCEMSN